MKAQSENNVYLYGVDHSPWVLGLWYSLNYLKYDVTLSSLPVSCKWVYKNGISFPVVKFNNNIIISDSFEIYRYLSKHQSTLKISTNGLQYQKELEKLFLIYSPLRAKKGKNFLFLDGWMKMKERPFSIIGSFTRGLLFYYYYSLIKISLIFTRFKKINFLPTEKIKKELMIWDRRVENSNWVLGENISFLDFALFGHIECMASGPTDEFISIIKENKNIIVWIERMMKTIQSIEPLHSRRIFDSKYQIKQNRKDQIVFFLSVTVWIIFFPITIIIIIYLLFIRNRGSNYSGARIK